MTSTLPFSPQAGYPCFAEVGQPGDGQSDVTASSGAPTGGVP